MSVEPAAESDAEARPWGTLVPGGWGGFWLKIGRLCPGGWPWSRLGLLARRLSRLTLQSPADVRMWGFRLRLRPRGSVSEARMLFLPRYWDRAERQLLSRWLGSGSVFVDVGANAGGYTFWAASRVGETGLVVAVEPTPELASRLRFNVATNGAQSRIRVVEAAVAASAGKGVLLRGESNSGESRLADPAEGPVEDPRRDTVAVTVVTLADVVRDAGVTQIDCLKVDVEGREADVLKPYLESASRSLWPATLVVELGQQVADSEEGACCAEELERWLLARGYRRRLRTRLNGVFRLDSLQRAK